jgi:hypothetical protein
MFYATQVCTKYESIHVAIWLHNFSWVLRATVFVSHVLNMNIVLALELVHKRPKKLKRKQYWMTEWFKKRVTFSNQNVLQELLVRSQVDYNSFMRIKHSPFLELLYMFLYQRLDSNRHVVQPHHSQCKRVAQQPCCKKNQNSSDFMQQIVQIVNQQHTRSTSCTIRNVAQHNWSWMGPFTNDFTTVFRQLTQEPPRPWNWCGIIRHKREGIPTYTGHKVPETAVELFVTKERAFQHILVTKTLKLVWNYSSQNKRAFQHTSVTKEVKQDIECKMLLLYMFCYLLIYLSIFI